MRKTLALFAALWAVQAAPAVAGQFEILSVGMYCPKKPEGERVQAPGTELGWVREKGVLRPHNVSGTNVPADPLLSFGVIYRVPMDMEPTTGYFLLEHPPMGEERSTRQVHTSELVPGQIQGSSWIFEYDYERVPGVWKRSLVVNEEVVWSVTFNVGPAGSNPVVNELCFDDAPMS